MGLNAEIDGVKSAPYDLMHSFITTPQARHVAKRSSTSRATMLRLVLSSSPSSAITAYRTFVLFPPGLPLLSMLPMGATQPAGTGRQAALCCVNMACCSGPGSESACIAGCCCSICDAGSAGSRCAAGGLVAEGTEKAGAGAGVGAGLHPHELKQHMPVAARPSCICGVLRPDRAATADVLGHDVGCCCCCCCTLSAASPPLPWLLLILPAAAGGDGAI